MLHQLPRSIRIAAALTGGLLLLAAVACDAAPKDKAVSAPPESQVTDAAQPTATAIEEAVPLERYRYKATLTLAEQRRAGDVVSVSTTGRFAVPDRHAVIFTMELVDGTKIERRLVAIGPRVWFKAGGPRWRSTNMRDRDVIDLIRTSFSPLRSDFVAAEGLTRVQTSVQDLYGAAEKVNGVDALHYRVDAAGNELIETFLPSEALSPAQDVSWDLWLAQDGGWPVRVQATFTIRHETQLLGGLGLQAPARWKLLIDVSTPNDPALMIYPPVAP